MIKINIREGLKPPLPPATVGEVIEVCGLHLGVFCNWYYWRHFFWCSFSFRSAAALIVLAPLLIKGKIKIEGFPVSISRNNTKAYTKFLPLIAEPFSKIDI